MTNYVQEGEHLPVACSSPTTPVVNNPVRFGDLTGVAETSEDSAGLTMVHFGCGMFNLSVTDSVGGGITAGSALWLHDGAPPTIDNVALNGYFFGYAWEAVSAGATATILVKHVGTTGGTQSQVVSAKATVSAQAATATLTNAVAGKIITNTGASGAIVLTLPAASTMSGKAVKIQVTVAQTVTLTPATGEKVYLGGSGVASKYALIAGVIGNFVDLYCDGTDYLIVNYSGVVTKES